MLTKQYQGHISTGLLSALLLLNGCQSQLNMAGEDGPSQSYDVFISHAGEDMESVVVPMYNELMRRGIRTFIDREGIWAGETGEYSPAIMNAAMETARCGVFILSPEFAAKKWPMQALGCFLRRQQNSDEERPIPIPVFHRLTLKECGLDAGEFLEKTLLGWVGRLFNKVC